MSLIALKLIKKVYGGYSGGSYVWNSVSADSVLDMFWCQSSSTSSITCSNCRNLFVFFCPSYHINLVYRIKKRATNYLQCQLRSRFSVSVKRLGFWLFYNSICHKCFFEYSMRRSSLDFISVNFAYFLEKNIFKIKIFSMSDFFKNHY